MSPARPARIIPLKPRARHTHCAGCGYPLRGAPAWWSLCTRCWASTQLVRALEAYRAAAPLEPRQAAAGARS